MEEVLNDNQESAHSLNVFATEEIHTFVQNVLATNKDRPPVEIVQDMLSEYTKSLIFYQIVENQVKTWEQQTQEIENNISKADEDNQNNRHQIEEKNKLIDKLKDQLIKIKEIVARSLKKYLSLVSSKEDINNEIIEKMDQLSQAELKKTNQENQLKDLEQTIQAVSIPNKTNSSNSLRKPSLNLRKSTILTNEQKHHISELAQQMLENNDLNLIITEIAKKSLELEKNKIVMTQQLKSYIENWQKQKPIYEEKIKKLDEKITTTDKNILSLETKIDELASQSNNDIFNLNLCFNNSVEPSSETHFENKLNSLAQKNEQTNLKIKANDQKINEKSQELEKKKKDSEKHKEKQKRQNRVSYADTTTTTIRPYPPAPIWHEQRKQGQKPHKKIPFTFKEESNDSKNDNSLTTQQEIKK